MSSPSGPVAGHTSPTGPDAAPQLDRMPARAQVAAVQFAAAPCPQYATDAAWRAERVTLVDTGRLHPREATMADLLPTARRGPFVGGRLALRAALQHAVAVSPPPSGERHPVPPVLRNARGAPVLPPGVTGSISHKRDLALAAAVHQHAPVKHLGVDLELRPTERDLERPSIAPRVLTVTEREALAAAQLDALAERERVLLHFSLKEAVYKAIDPYVQRYVGFTEVEVQVLPHGEAEVTLLLPDAAVDGVAVTAHWQLDGAWIVTSAFARGR